MRIRIRGPSGQSIATLDDATATIDILRKTIETETSLSSFDVKYGYPPRTLSLDQYPPNKLLTELDVKLNGEQLLITRSESSIKQTLDEPTTKPSQPNTASSSSRPISASNPLGAPASLTPKAPLNLTRKANANMDDPPEIPLPSLGGTIILRIMPDDNSCLFRAISASVMSDMDAVTELRSIVAETIISDPDTYSSAILDNKAPSAYCRWIKSSDSWGGQVELVILAKYFGVEIFAIDVQHLRVDRYNESPHHRRCIVVYSGIHYDTVALNIGGGGEPEADVKLFEPEIKEEALQGALELCGQLNQRHYYTDTAGFKIRCNDCGAEVVGEKGATEHASRTGHYNFGEAS
jgi:ubiquitin thioesterase OTU1